MRFTAAITHETNWYAARCLEVEVTSQGRSVEEARACQSLRGTRALLRGPTTSDRDRAAYHRHSRPQRVTDGLPVCIRPPGLRALHKLGFYELMAAAWRLLSRWLEEDLAIRGPLEAPACWRLSARRLAARISERGDRHEDSTRTVGCTGLGSGR